MKCEKDVCSKEAITGSQFCLDHMGKTEAKERLAQLLEKLEDHEKTYLAILQEKRIGEENIALAQARQDYEATAPQEFESIEQKIEFRQRQAEIQGEIKSVSFAAFLKTCQTEEMFMEMRYLNLGKDGRHFIVLNDVYWPIVPDRINKVPHPIAELYRNKVKMFSQAERMRQTLSVGNADTGAKPMGEWLQVPQYAAKLEDATKGKI